jgi:uncharacterized delta-60 repeat protein
MIDITWDGTYKEVGENPPTEPPDDGNIYYQMTKTRIIVDLISIKLETQYRNVTVTLTDCDETYQPAIFTLIKGHTYLDLLVDNDASVMVESAHYDHDNNLVAYDKVKFIASTGEFAHNPSGIGITIFNQFIVFSPDTYTPTDLPPELGGPVGYGHVLLNWGGNDAAYGLVVDESGKTWVVAQNSDSMFAVARINSDGTLDQSFGTNGYYEFNFPGSTYGGMFSIIDQPNQQMLLSGWAMDNASEGGYPWGICRLNSDGTIDTSFGTNGLTVTRWTSADSGAPYSMEIQSVDGKTVIAGAGGGNPYSFSVARYNSDGSPDNSFGTNGMASVSFPGNNNQSCYCITVQPDGKILLFGGVDSGSSTNRPALARLQANGSGDQQFGQGGEVLETYSGAYLSSNSYYQPVGALALLESGKILTGFGAGWNPTASAPNTCVIAQYNTNGTVDKTFGASGYAVFGTLPSGQSATAPYGIVIQSTGKIVVLTKAWTGQAGTGWDIALLRINPDGSLDQSFGTNGEARLSPDPYGTTGNSATGSIIVLSDDSLLISGSTGGYSSGSYHGNSFIVHLTADGAAIP